MNKKYIYNSFLPQLKHFFKYLFILFFSPPFIPPYAHFHLYPPLPLRHHAVVHARDLFLRFFFFAQYPGAPLP